MFRYFQVSTYEQFTLMINFIILLILGQLKHNSFNVGNSVLYRIFVRGYLTQRSTVGRGYPTQLLKRTTLYGFKFKRVTVRDWLSV